MALCGSRGSLCREALRNLASRLSCALYSLCRGTSTGGSTAGETGRGGALGAEGGAPPRPARAPRELWPAVPAPPAG